jgi:2-hydroxy-4-carboxymuconate semialdehyde hemiacetal dehydrogenase
MMKLALAGAGAFGRKHLAAIQVIDGAEVTSIVDRPGGTQQSVAREYGIEHWSDNLADVLALDEVDAVILATPTQMHASQAIACLEAGKHVLVEIPLADNLADAEAVVDAQQRTGKVCMVGHVRRFNPSHQWVHNKIQAGEFSIQQMDVQTFFFRRANRNALGEPRTWTDHLLWHHAAHTIDLFAYQTGEEIVAANILEGPLHPDLGIAMDMSIQMKTSGGSLLSLSLSFNNDGPLGTFFRYIGDTGTYVASYDDLVDGRGEPIDVSRIDVSMNGIELESREFISAITEGREPKSSVSQVISCYRHLHALEQQLHV